MLSNSCRLLTYVTAGLYGVLGLLLFVFPRHMAADFAWKVTPFMTMTIGGWCLGNAWLAWSVARRWTWSLVYPAFVYLAVFGFGELGVLLWFRHKLVLDHAIAWLYLVALIANAALVVLVALEAARIRPAREAAGAKTSDLLHAGVLAFIAFVGFLAIYGLVAGRGDPGLSGGTFPEPLSPFTLRSFGVFYLALTLSVVPLVWDRSLRTFLSHGYVSYGFIVFITLAAFVYIGKFDFIDRPGGVVYIGAYVVVAVIFALSFLRYGTGDTEPVEYGVAVT
jgi:hypothetical protein